MNETIPSPSPPRPTSSKASGQFLLSLIVLVLLLVANCLVIQNYQTDRESFKAGIIETQTHFFEGQRKILEGQSAILTAHTADVSLHMPLDDKLKTFVPRPVADDRYASLKIELGEIKERLETIEKALVP